ncbi:MAG: chlorophyll synthase ChlG [Gammaproteobacteria bacterium]|nr:chlorophyll synthase ChlG [Gammaproteobacteria bacterium]
MTQQQAILMPSRPEPGAVLALLKPITWFPPMWAFGCGVVSVWDLGRDTESWWLAAAGIVLAGPLVCGTSQAVNDWFDRHVDAINEPDRPIPSGRIPNRWGLYIAVTWTVLSLAFAGLLGAWVFAAAVVGMSLAWAYSAPPLRLKQNGWWGNSAVAICYEGLPWFTGAAIISGALPHWHIIVLALLYSTGAHGIMTLNDFKAIEGDHRTGVRSLPVQLGAARAARCACGMMLLPQLVVIGLLFVWNHSVHAGIVSLIVLIQVFLMRRLMTSPRELAPWYNATGVSLFVMGMLVSALAIQSGIVSS